MLRELRKQAGLTQKELAERTNLSRPAIALYETGARNLNVQAAKRIALVLGCDWWRLCEDDSREVKEGG